MKGNPCSAGVLPPQMHGRNVTFGIFPKEGRSLPYANSGQYPLGTQRSRSHAVASTRNTPCANSVSSRRRSEEGECLAGTIEGCRLAEAKCPRRVENEREAVAALEGALHKARRKDGVCVSRGGGAVGSTPSKSIDERDCLRAQPPEPEKGIVMNGVMQILLVEDNPDDRALVIRELGREFPAREFTFATNFKELNLA